MSLKQHNPLQFILSMTWIAILGLMATAPLHAADTRPRIIVLTDLSNEPDDEESLVRFLIYANEFEVEAMVATTSIHLRTNPHEELLHRDIDAYSKVRTNLDIHAAGYPTAEYLHSVCRTGQPGYGMAAVGDGKSTPGSKRIIEVVDKTDDRPVWISIWGGANTLAQALWDVQKTRDSAAVDKFISKLRVYTISDQDDSGHWMRPQFPALFYICSPGNVGGSDYWRSTWAGISGDRWYKIGVMHHFEMVDNPWLEKHIIKDHGPLGALYPRVSFIMEGDTPSFLGLINNGLGWSLRPDYGGWGGRYQESQPWGEKRKLWTDGREARDTVTSDDNGRTETSNHASIWRWREHFQNDFAARIHWSATDDFSKANHNPTAVLNWDSTRDVLEMNASSETMVELTAEGSRDPDGDRLMARWWIYNEASTLRDDKTRRFPESIGLTATNAMKTSLSIPKKMSRPGIIHVILEVHDSGTPSLWSYRRAVIRVK